MKLLSLNSQNKLFKIKYIQKKIVLKVNKYIEKVCRWICVKTNLSIVFSVQNW